MAHDRFGYQGKKNERQDHKVLREAYLLEAEVPPLGSVHAQISPILDNTLLMKADLVKTAPAAACFVTVDNGWGLETVKQRMQVQGLLSFLKQDFTRR